MAPTSDKNKRFFFIEESLHFMLYQTPKQVHLTLKNAIVPATMWIK